MKIPKHPKKKRQAAINGFIDGASKNFRGNKGQAAILNSMYIATKEQANPTKRGIKVWYE